MAQLATITSVHEPQNVWRQRYYKVLTILGWTAFAGVVLWLIGLIIEPLVYLIVSALLGFILYPAVRLFQRFMPRPLAILSTLLLIVGVLLFILYILAIVVFQQLTLLVAFIQHSLQGPTPSVLQPVVNFLQTIGISSNQLHISGEQIFSYLNSFVTGIIPFVGSVIQLFVSVLLITSLCVYFMVDGARITEWFKHRTPLKMRGRVEFFLDTTGRSIGGFVRGQLTLAIIVSILLGVGALLLGIPYAALIGLVVFVFEFIPIIGPYISGITSILLALTHGWQAALVMTLLVILIQQVLDGQILSPRILGHSVGLHPIVAIFALLVGGSLFGLLGAFLSAPVAGVIQTFVVSLWLTWKEQHPDQFPEGMQASPESHKQGLDHV